MLLNLCGIKRMSRIGESRKLDSLVTQMGVAKLSEMAKPESAEKKRISASAEFSGVVRDSAYGKDDRGTRETLLLESAEAGINNLQAGQKRVGQAHKSEDAE